MNPADALREFEFARGHPLERQNYIDHLLSLRPTRSAEFD
ncbi:hypothetical protein T265_12285 [Opisthorchis viverrini]|uniref:Uncharacterized protein n=1 Tax=Opisthorchis viverrini TaxID=6198 RepID=A0A074YUM1_OPIVI|nr:hypothetical protein T265_12285 [Opisthorchis viverrini]KER18403.1 hypothetical protein T265_12285 [Opisthorchis viverrini]